MPGFDIVDPLGTLPGQRTRTFYFTMMEEMAQSIINCQDKFDMLDDLNNLD